MLTYRKMNDENGFVAGWSAVLNGKTVCAFWRCLGWDIERDQQAMDRHTASVLANCATTARAA